MNIVHDAKYARKGAPRASGLWTTMRLAAHFPTSGACPYARPVENLPAVQKTIADNIKRLLEYSETHSERGPASRKALAAKIVELAKASGATRVDRRTIQRALKGGVSLRVDTVGAIASAYKLAPWQLLLPGLDPADPQVVLSAAEKRRFALAEAALRQLKELEHGPTGTTGLGGDNPAPKPPDRRRKKRDAT